MKNLFIFLMQMLNKFFCALIRLYRKCISPLFPPCCRFYPTCSAYSLEAFQKYGPVKGLYLSTKRIVKCNPFSKGGYDPLPEKSFHKENKNLRKK